MAIFDVTSESGINELNTFLRDNSYITGYQPTLDDTTVFSALKKAPNDKSAHLLRWYNHIQSFEVSEQKAFPKGAGVSFKSGSGPAPAPVAAKDDDDDVDLFGSDDEEDAEAEKVREERLKAYNEKKSKKPALIAKSNIILDVKPWDDETDMKDMEDKVRSIVVDGLLWGASQLKPVGYGIKKLQISCVVEDEKVSVDQLVEDIQAFEDLVQSVDIAAFNKI